MLAREFTDRFYFTALINCAELRGLRQTERMRLRRVNVGMPRESGSDVVQVKLAIIACRQNQFCSAGKKFRRATFVGQAVRAFVTNHAVVRAAQMRERQCVRSSAVENEKYFAVLLKN